MAGTEEREPPSGYLTSHFRGPLHLWFEASRVTPTNIGIGVVTTTRGLSECYTVACIQVAPTDPTSLLRKNQRQRQHAEQRMMFTYQDQRVAIVEPW